jgi:ribosome-binding factor A
MDFKRSDRVGDRIAREVSDLLLKKVNDPRVGFVTVTHVKCSDDLRNASVFVSVMGNEEAKKNCMEGLKSALPYLQKEVFKRLNIKVPTLLYFKLDDSITKGKTVNSLLKQLRDEREEKDEHGQNESSPA